MTLAFASGPLYAALNQPVCVVAVSVLPASPWLVAVLVARTFDLYVMVHLPVHESAFCLANAQKV